jgi:hypothetical protein
MNLITGMRVGTKVNLMINGTLHSKECGDNEVAKIFFTRLLEVKADPTDENVESLYEFLNKNIRVAKMAGFEYDPQKGETYMEGFNTPVPELLVDTIEDYLENGYPVESITNFWKLLMANPDKRVREDLFKFIATHDFSLTEKGYMVVYKTVDYMNMVTQDVASFVSNAYLKVRKDWGTSAGKYVVYKDFDGDFADDFELKLTKKVTFAKWDVDEKAVELVGNLDDLQKNLDTLINDGASSVFTDLHTHKMEIKLGEPVKFNREECDADPKVSCSYGLHVGATSYVQSFANSNSVVLVCLVNPMNVMAVPEYDNSKMRVCEYYPFALATFEDRKIDIIEQKYFEYDYVSHEEEELTRLLEASEDDVRQTAMNADDDDRDYEEYVSILEARVIDLAGNED